MKFVIRDDDLNYFSTPEDITRWYEDVFLQGIPVGFSAIPYVTPMSDVYTADAVPEDTEYAIGSNTNLVSYVTQNPLIEVLQHGTTHETIGGAFEYARPVSRTETLRGREELERAFGSSVTVFVPPHDWIGSSGIRSVEHAKMNIIRGRGAGLRNLILRFEYVSIFLRMLWYKARHAVHGKVPAYPHVLDFGLHKEACSYRLEDTDVFEGLEYAHKKDGIFVVVTHVHTLDEERKKLLMELIEKAKGQGAEFVRPSALFEQPTAS
ncbi:MAG: hypothetical protein V4682_00065 [Patescibacteria group bacterium]